MTTIMAEPSGDVETILTALRHAIVFEKNERTDAPFEARQAAQRRIDAAHVATLQMIREARQAGVTKTQIAEQLGVQGLYKVNQLLKEAGE